MLKEILFTGIILFNASTSLATTSASSSAQKMLYKYETGIGAPLPKQDYVVKIDVKGCSNVFTQLQDRYGRINGGIEIFKYCPIGASTSTVPVRL